MVDTIDKGRTSVQEMAYFVRGDPKVGPRSVLRHIFVVELKSFSLYWEERIINIINEEREGQRGRLLTHLVIGHKYEGLLSKWRVPSHSRGKSTLLYAVCAK